MSEPSKEPCGCPKDDERRSPYDLAHFRKLAIGVIKSESNHADELKKHIEMMKNAYKPAITEDLLKKAVANGFSFMLGYHQAVESYPKEKIAEWKDIILKLGIQEMDIESELERGFAYGQNIGRLYG